MPQRPSRPCNRPGCDQMAAQGQGQCAEHLEQVRKATRRRRGNSAQQGYGHRHRDRFRVGVLVRDRTCVLCRKSPAVIADHYPVDRRTLVARGLDPDNPRHGRGLCKRCHDQETARRQPGGWHAWNQR